MARVVTQETFDSVVQENIVDFDMNTEEAIEDARKQFEAQGVDLSNIIMEKLSESQQVSVITIVNKLSSLTSKKLTDTSELASHISSLKAECDKGLAQKVLAGKNGAYDHLVNTIELYSDNKSVALPALLAITSLMTGNPDLLDERGIVQMNEYLNKQKDADLILQILKWTKQCCIKHEKNRQLIFDSNILLCLKHHLHNTESTPVIIRGVCGVVRALVMDDDIRVEFGRAHEHARQLAVEVLCDLTDLLKKHKTDPETIGDLMQTLSSLVVKDELCQKVETAGGLTFVRDVMMQFQENEKLMKQCLKLLKALGGNDNVKAHIMETGCASLIVSALNIHNRSVDLALAGCAAISALTLRSPINSKEFYDAGAAEAILDAMKLHPANPDVQRNASWAIRNIVSRDRSLCAKFLELGAEELLHTALKTHKDKCEYDIKAALRDLGCEVELKERWTGKGGKLHTQNYNP